MNQTQLAERLKDTSARTLAKNRDSQVFSSWSQKRDPDGLGWRYDVESKMYHPIVD